MIKWRHAIYSCHCYRFLYPKKVYDCELVFLALSEKIKRQDFAQCGGPNLPCFVFFLPLEPNQLIALMLTPWKQLSESASRPPPQTLQPIASAASWVLSNPVDFAKRKPSLVCGTVWMHQLSFMLEKRSLPFYPIPGRPQSDTHQTHPRTPLRSRLRLSWGVLRCPSTPICLGFLFPACCCTAGLARRQIDLSDAGKPGFWEWKSCYGFAAPIHQAR